MNYSEQIKPISYLKAHASELVEEVNLKRITYIITKNGYAKAVLIGIREYEELMRDIGQKNAELKKSKLKKRISKLKKTRISRKK